MCSGNLKNSYTDVKCDRPIVNKLDPLTLTAKP